MKKLIIIIILLIPGVLFSQNTDIRLLRAINSPETLSSDGFFRFISDSNGYIDFAVPVSIGIAGIVKKNDKLKKQAFEIAGASVITAGITLAMKYTINRQRPFITYPDITKKSGAASPSFPSGHTSSSFAVATSLSLLFPKWYVVVPSYAWAGTVGYSRMHLGVHYPSDVLAGAIIGSGCAWLTYAVNKKLTEKHNKK